MEKKTGFILKQWLKWWYSGIKGEKEEKNYIFMGSRNKSTFCQEALYLTFD